MSQTVAHPCPYCEGGSMSVKFDPESQCDVVVCNQCGAKGPIYNRLLPKEELAIEAWNMRGGQRTP